MTQCYVHFLIPLRRDAIHSSVHRRSRIDLAESRDSCRALQHRLTNPPTASTTVVTCWIILQSISDLKGRRGHAPGTCAHPKCTPILRFSSFSPDHLEHDEGQHDDVYHGRCLRLQRDLYLAFASTLGGRAYVHTRCPALVNGDAYRNSLLCWLYGLPIA